MTEDTYSGGAAVAARAAEPEPLQGIRGWFARAGRLPFAFNVHTSAGITTLGEGEPIFDLYIRNERGMKALRSLHELVIADAYVRGDLDLEGDVVRAMWLRDALSD